MTSIKNSANGGGTKSQDKTDQPYTVDWWRIVTGWGKLLLGT